MSAFATVALALLLMLALLLAPVLAALMLTLVPEPAPYAEQLSPGHEAITSSSFGKFDDAKATSSFGNPARAPPTSTTPADQAGFVR